jgi:arabinofuranosyltransferase
LNGSPRRANALPLATLAVLVALLATAWVGEDALITFRVVDNVASGHGLRWNVGERVQTYTHPLWMLLLTACYLCTHEIYFTATAVCILCSLGGFWVAARPFRDRPGLIVGALLVPFLLTRSLVIFSTSGFENPLTLLLLSVLAALLFRVARGGAVPWFRISLVAALIGTNRLDTLLIPLAAMLVLVVSCRARLPWTRVALGFLPLVAWLLFSLLYYGSPFPNTAPAKLSSALPLDWYVRRGLGYLLVLFRMDLAGGLLLALGLGLGGRAIGRWCRGRATPRDRAAAALGAGLFVYTLYVIRIGGDFIVGRFWTAPLWLSILLLAIHASDILLGMRRLSRSGRAVALVMAAGLLVLVYGVALHATLRLFGNARPADFRSKAHVRLGTSLEWEISAGGARFREMGRAARRSGRAVVRIDPIGFAGIEAGRAVTIVDAYGLADPLVARLRPVVPASKIGHLYREIPPGYLRYKENGALDALDPDLRAYASALRRITRDPLWNPERLRTILLFHSGRYEASLRRYETRNGTTLRERREPGAATIEEQDREPPRSAGHGTALPETRAPCLDQRGLELDVPLSPVEHGVGPPA